MCYKPSIGVTFSNNAMIMLVTHTVTSLFRS